MDIRDLPSAIPATNWNEDVLVSALGSFSRGAISMLPLGKQAYAGIAGVAQNEPYKQERAELDEEEGQDKALNPTARILGQITGVVAPAVATSGLSAPASMGEAALQGAGVGAGFGAGNAIDTLANGGNGRQAAADVALGAGAGAAGGAAGQALGNLISPTVSKLGPTADELKAEVGAALTGGTTRQIRALPGKNPVSTINDFMDSWSNKTVNGEPLIDQMDRLPERLDKFIALQGQAGKVIGDTIKNAEIDDIPVGVITDPLEKAKESFQFAGTPYEPQIDGVINNIKNHANTNGGKAFTFEKLQQLKTEIGEHAFRGQGDPVLQEAYHTISDIQDAKLEEISMQLGRQPIQPTTPTNEPILIGGEEAPMPPPASVDKAAFDNAKGDYQMTSRVIPMLRMGVSREVGQKMPTFLPALAAVTGHPTGVIGALAKNRVGQIGAGLLYKGMNAAPQSLGNAASRIPSMAGAQMAASQPPQQQKQQAVMEYLLQSNSPAYARSKSEEQQ